MKSNVDPRFRVQHIAHRGSRLEGLPENTLASFAHAVAAGSDVIELDVWLTKDEKVVVFHDADLERMCGAPASRAALATVDAREATTKPGTTRERRSIGIPDLLFHELPEISLDSEAHWAVDAGNRAEACRIPLFSEVLALVPPHKTMIVEVKQKSAVS